MLKKLIIVAAFPLCASAQTVTSITILPDPVNGYTNTINTTTQLSALVCYTSGPCDNGTIAGGLTWSSPNPSTLLTVDNTGKVTIPAYNNVGTGALPASPVNGQVAWTTITTGSPGFYMGQTGVQRISNWFGTGITTGGTQVTLGGSALSVGCTAQSTIAVTGSYPITTTMQCGMSGVGGNPANIQPQCSVTALNTVTPYLCTAVAGTPASQLYSIRVTP